MLETLCMSSMHDSVFWFVSAGCPLLRFRIGGNFRRKNNSAGAVPSLDTVLLLYLLQEL